MACSQLLNGILRDCGSSMGGIRRVWLANRNNITSAKVVDNIITEINKSRGTIFAVYEFRPNTGVMVSNWQINAESGINYVQTEVSLMFSRLETSKRLEIIAISRADMVAVVEDLNSRYWYLGYDYPVTLSAGDAPTGKALADLNGYNISLKDTSRVLPYEVDPEVIPTLTELPPVDLSLYDIFGNELPGPCTANAYVVHKAGNFSIPLVYGNAIKNGAANPAAYTRQGSNYTADFVNHLGNQLTSPYIEENAGCTVVSAGLLWQTEPDMVTKVTFGDGLLNFKITAVPARNGLAVLYVKDANGDIIWSWAIWVTSEILSEVTLTNHTGVEYTMMSTPFGAIRDFEYNTFMLPHYQWGRKDPQIPVRGFAAGDIQYPMEVYDISGNVYTGAGTYGVLNDQDASGTERSVANSIKWPNLFFIKYSNHGCWCNLAWYNNFWNAAFTASGGNNDDQDSAVKTIYDPTPVGFIVPGPRWSTGFTTTGGGTYDVSTGGEVVPPYSSGWHFKANAQDTVGYFLPTNGNRYRDNGEYSSVAINGCWWSYAAENQDNERYLFFTPTSILPIVTQNRATGMAVCPSKH